MSHPESLAASAAPGAAGVTVRPARADELAEAGDVVRLAYAADGYAGEYLDVVADAADRSRDAEIVVAVDRAGRVLGCVTFVLPGSRWAELSVPGQAEFRMLGVLPQARGRGVGRALTVWCIERARTHAARQVVLCSLPSMTVAHRLYDDLGFRRSPDLDWTPKPGVELLGFLLELDPADGSAPQPAGEVQPAG
ncbi:MAG TPA: GNAT family N-acetyltransferase [Kineosporiaceae bacterium]|nr:GNAT family N-acetyltransferase [Kineosporiaceae bacterium]